MTELAAKLTGVGKDYRYFSLNGIDLEVPDGQILGFIGPNGAGKSITIRILMGLVHQDRGEVRVCGRAIPADQAAAKWDVGFASEDDCPTASGSRPRCCSSSPAGRACWCSMSRRRGSILWRAMKSFGS